MRLRSAKLDSHEACSDLAIVSCGIEEAGWLAAVARIRYAGQ